MAGEAGSTGMSVRRALGVLAFFALLTTLHTWPLVPQLSSSIGRSPDVPINLWAVNDLAGQILGDWTHLLDGRIFYPFPRTLAFVDHQITNAVLATPFVASGQDLIIVYNLVLLATFLLSGVFCYLLVRGLTGSTGAGLVAGSVYAFSAYRFNHFEHLHLLGTQWLPLALLALHRYLARPTWLRLSAVAGSGLLVAFSSWQLAVIGAVGLAVAALTTMLADGRPIRRRAATLVLVAALIGLALSPLATVYSAASADWGRPGGETTGSRVDMSARPSSFLTPPGGSRAPYAALLRSPAPPPPAFPGVFALLLVVPAVWMLIRFRASSVLGLRGRVLFWLACTPVILAAAATILGSQWAWVVDVLRPIAPVAILCGTLAVVGVRFARSVRGSDPGVVVVLTYSAVALVGAFLALGPYVLVGDTNLGRGVYWPDQVPPLSLLRAPERFTLLTTLGVSILAGVGFTQLRRRVGVASWVVSAAVLVALNLDIRQAPLAFDLAPAPRPPVYTWLTNAPQAGAVLEYPWDNRWSVYNNFAHGRRMVHGRAYIWPYLSGVLQELPALSPRHLTQLWEYFHPRFIVLRAGLYPPDVRADVLRAVQDQPLALRLRARFEDDYVYELIDRGVGTRLYRVWPKEELEHRRGFAIAGRVTGARDGTIPRLAVRLNGLTMLDRWGAEADRPYPRVLWLDPEQISPGLNALEIFAGYRFGDGEPGYAIGATGVSLAADVVVTAGRDRAMVEVNGQLEQVERGYLLAVLDADTGEIADIGSFDTSANRDESERLAVFIDNIPVGSPVLVSSQFDVSRQLTESAVQALRTLGLREDLRGRFNWIHAAIGAKGAPPGSALEGVDRQVSRLTLGELATRVWNSAGSRSTN